MAPKRAAASAPPHFSTPLYHTFPRLGTAPAPNLLSGNNSLPLGTFQHQPGHGPQATPPSSGPAGFATPCKPQAPARRGPPSRRLWRPAAAYEGLRPSTLRAPPPPFPSGPKFSLPARPCGPAAACGRPRSLIPLPPSPAPNGRSAAGTAAPSPRCPTASAPRKKPAQLPRSWPGAPPFSATVPPKAP